MAIQIQIPVKELQATRKLFIATPMYGGQCHGIYSRAMMELTNHLTRMQVPHVPYFLFNESLITRARNYCCDEFMRSDCTHMLFIDSDIGFKAEDIIALLALQQCPATIEQMEYLKPMLAEQGVAPEDIDKKVAEAHKEYMKRYEACEYDVIGAPYPKKTIAWEKIKMAVDKGFADPEHGGPEALGKYVGDYVFNPKGNVARIPIGQPVEVLEIGTGFMLIRRKTFEVLNEKFPELLYKPDHVRTEHFDGSRKIMMYFQAAIDPASERYLSEDYWFCQKIQEVGLKAFLCPWMQTIHAGAYMFAGSLTDLAALGAPATADVDQIAASRKAQKDLHAQQTDVIPPPEKKKPPQRRVPKIAAKMPTTQLEGLTK